MLPWLLVIFVTVPIAEIAVFIEVGGRYGVWPTVAAIFATAIAGTFLIRLQGLAVIRDVQRELEAGELPALRIFDGLCLLIAGALLLTPGFITDGIGFLLLVPPVRAALAVYILSRLATLQHPGGGPGTARDADGNVIIDGEFRDVSDAPGEGDGDDEPPSLPGRR